MREQEHLKLGDFVEIDTDDYHALENAEEAGEVGVVLGWYKSPTGTEFVRVRLLLSEEVKDVYRRWVHKITSV